MFLIATGAFFNAVRGGQFGVAKPDIVNAIAFAVTIFVMSGNWLLSVCSMAAMWLGAAPGWGDYIGALGGWRKDSLKENKFIDKLIKKLVTWPFWWGFAGLTVRGLWWGLCLATPFWFMGYNAVGWSFIYCGASMALVYWAAIAWMKKVGHPAGDGWGLGEIFFGAILWSALGGL